MTNVGKGLAAGPARRRPRKLIGTFALAALAALLTGCPSSLPPPERLDLATDARVMRGEHVGTVDTRVVPWRTALAGDGSLMAASWKESLELWDLATMQPVASIATPNGDFAAGLAGLSVDADGSSVAGILQGEAKLWDGRTGAELRTFAADGRLGACAYCGIYVLALAPSGDQLAAAGQAPQVLVFDAGTGAVARELAVAGDAVAFVGFSADGTRLAAGSRVSDERYALRVWDTASFAVVFDHVGSVRPGLAPRFAFSADGRTLAVSSATELELIGVGGGARLMPLDPDEGQRLLAINPDATQAAVELAGDVAVLDTASGATIGEFEGVQSLATSWSSDGTYLMTGSKLVRGSDLSLVRDFALGQLHTLDLVAEPRFVNASLYEVTGTASIDGGEATQFTGEVIGNESQRYLRPQARAPELASLTIELAGNPWRLQARQATAWSAASGYSPVPAGDWWGLVTDSAAPDQESGYPLVIRRAP